MVIDNESVRQFWIHDYEKYGKDDLGPPRNKLSKLLVSGTVSLMLSQPESLFNFRQINLDSRDAQYLAKDLRKLVDADDIVALDAYQAIAKNRHRHRKNPNTSTRSVPSHHFRSRIIEESHRKYYKPAHEVRKWIARGAERWGSPHVSASSVIEGGGENEAFAYDEFTD